MRSKDGTLALALAAALLVVGCGSAPGEAAPGEAAPGEAAPSEAAPGEVAKAERAVTPWGIYRERRREAEDAALEARAQVEALEREHARLARERAELERKAAEPPAAAPTTPAAPTPTTPATPAPMTPATPGPAPAPMSRPEPELRPLPIPPFAYTLRAEAPVAHQGPEPRLEVRSVKRNGIIDEEAWFRTHGLALPTYAVVHTSLWGSTTSPGDPLPPEIPTALAGHDLSEAIRGPDHTVALYSPGGGRFRQAAVVLDPLGDSLGSVEISAWPHGQEIHWAQSQDGVLYLCTSHMTYASSTGGLNAFMTAVELRTGELLWQSEPLVCNTRNFLLRDGWILSGYGFTAEPDFLYVLDMKTGAVASKLKLKSGPEVILEEGGTLFVRTYDRDYELEVR